MTARSHTLPRSATRFTGDAGAAALLDGTAALTFFTTGAGMLEGHAVYPSWYDLAAFPDFAGYHARFGAALLPWLPAPLLLATLLNGVLVVKRPAGVPGWLPVATLLGQVFVIGVTLSQALPLQAQLATPGHTPSEIFALLDRLIQLNWWREVPGLAVASGFVVMLTHAMSRR